MLMRLIFAACLCAAVFAPAGIAVTPTSTRAAAFEPQVSVWISDDAPGGHPDITTTIEASSGPMFVRTETLTPVGGGTHRYGDIPTGWRVGEIGGFVTVPGADGQCNQRFTYNNIMLLEADPDPATFPAFLRELAPGAHLVRYTADVASTPVNIIMDNVQIDGVTRLRATTFVGDPSLSLPTCAPFKSRVIMMGQIDRTPPLPYPGYAPPTSGPRVYEFKFTSRDGDVVERKATATVQPGLRPRLEGDRVTWSAVPRTASLSLGGSATYTTTCALIRRLAIRQETRGIGQKLPADATSAQLPVLPGTDYEWAQIWADVIAYDSDGVLLARDNVQYDRDFKTCWYPPGEEPLLHVEPEAGPCTGTVTFTGERFPAGVNVEITMPPYGSDVSGPRVAVAPVAADGTFAVAATLPATACAIASMFPDGHMGFASYNADEPKGMTMFAGAGYVASIPPGYTPPPIFGPVTGAGPPAARDATPWAGALALAGAMMAGGGLALRPRSGER